MASRIAPRDDISQWANEERSLLGYMIRGLSPVRPSIVTASQQCDCSSSSSLGSLNRLPPEILTMMLGLLDFQSLSRMSQSSSGTKSLVEETPAYRDMMRHAPETIIALSKSGLIHVHSSAFLYHTLRSTKTCVSCCCDFGGFLLLPTCERVCFECLNRNMALRVIRVNDAKDAFGLTEAHLGQIPVMRTVAGSYGLRFSITQPQRKDIRLVNVAQAKRLAIEVHGSLQAMERIDPPTYSVGSMAGRVMTLFAAREASLDPPGVDMSLTDRGRNLPSDEFGGAACIRFPFLSPIDAASPGLEGYLAADNGYLCRGCELTSNLYKHNLLPPHVVQQHVDGLGPSHDPKVIFWAATSRLRTADDFRAHVEDCYGVQELRAGRCLHSILSRYMSRPTGH